jgi:hypothetical protein
MDKTKFGEALARTMDSLDRQIEHGELTEDWQLDEVLVVAALKRPSPEADDADPEKVEIFIFVDGTTQLPYTQKGILTMAAETGEWIS